jgi:hypothetical protein
VEDGAIVAGWIERKQPHNDFLATRREFGNFELRLQYKLEGTNGFVNGGVQFWSQRVPNDFEVSGYQADLGADTDGNLYDESRRNRNVAEAKKETREEGAQTGRLERLPDSRGGRAHSALAQRRADGRLHGER